MRVILMVCACLWLAACVPDRSAQVQQWLQRERGAPVPALPSWPDEAGLTTAALQVAADTHPFQPVSPALAASAGIGMQGAPKRSSGVYVGWLLQGGRRMGVLQRDNGWLIVRPGDALEPGETVLQLDARQLVLQYAMPARRVHLLLQEGVR